MRAEEVEALRLVGQSLTPEQRRQVISRAKLVVEGLAAQLREAQAALVTLLGEGGTWPRDASPLQSIHLASVYLHNATVGLSTQSRMLAPVPTEFHNIAALVAWLESFDRGVAGG